MKDKCPNCGAPIDVENGKCDYCGSRFEKPKTVQEKTTSNQEYHEKTGYNIDLSDNDGCLSAILTIGLISLFTGGHHGPHHRPPRFPR